MHLHNSDVLAQSFQASGGFEVRVVQNLLQAGGQQGMYLQEPILLSSLFKPTTFFWILGFERVGLGKLCFGWAG